MLLAIQLVEARRAPQAALAEVQGDRLIAQHRTRENDYHSIKMKKRKKKKFLTQDTEKHTW